MFVDGTWVPSLKRILRDTQKKKRILKKKQN